MSQTLNRTIKLPGSAASATTAWQPALALHEQTGAVTTRLQPVLYLHGATFPAANSVLFKFDDVSWAHRLNTAGHAVFALDFAGFGGSELYPEMTSDQPSAGLPVGRAPVAAKQIERAVRTILAETGAARVAIVAHSWGTMAAGLFATQHPTLVDRLVFFGPIVRREILKAVPALAAWRFLTVEEQYTRFVEDVPKDHEPVLLDRHFDAWSALYLMSDLSNLVRQPASVKTPNGPVADIMGAWSGTPPYDPALITVPVTIIRGAWDSLCTDADANALRVALRSSQRVSDVKLVNGTHVMHLEENRALVHEASVAALRVT
jgi:pimeloyl-ACP methyl ester carboxylesterase